MTGWADSLAISKADCSDLDLVYQAAWSGAVTSDELSAWIIDLQAMRSPVTTPAWLLHAPDEIGSPMDFHKALGFVPSGADGDEVRATLDGLAWTRGQSRGDPSLGECTPRAAALSALTRNRPLIERLARIIPQADLPLSATEG
ncbi:hypothetical protein [Thetidibacter halocola]|uniref:Uncharacterized protein n=1 Tax=Thetidibacter halocola TaxID=2827239 RepID=A0A8J7WC43_9RHOB|nr:hypothetical protein [Thetidibacter halocola]MBS0124855.1 hypothetical protein [Thetidibacter halocola]